MQKRVRFKWKNGRVTHLWPDYPLVIAGNEILTNVIEDIEKEIPKELVINKIATEFTLPIEEVRQYVTSVADAIGAASRLVEETPGTNHKATSGGGLCMATLNLTRKCDLRCTHCYAGAGQSMKELSSAQTRESIIKLARLIKNDPKLLILSGGEPTIAIEKLKIAVLTARECGLHPRLNTNGQSINESTAHFLAENEVLTQVSLDGLDPETNALIRGSMAAFDKTIAAIKLLQNVGCRTRISFTVHSENIHQIPGMLSLAESLGVEQVVTSNLVTIGNAKTSVLKSVTHKEEFRILYEAVRLSKARQKMTRSTLLGETIGAIRAGIRFTYCGTGHSTCCVDADGAVYPCINIMRPEYHRFNVTDENFPQVFELPETWPDLRTLDVDSLNPQCARCVCRYFCGGYCRGETLSCGKSLTDPYVRCASWKRGIYAVFDILSETPDIYDLEREPLSAIMHRE